MEAMEMRKSDILIIGAGAAGLRAALSAAEAGSEVLIVNKGPVGRSGITLTAAGGLQAPFHAEDSPQAFFEDTVRFGYYLGDQNLAKALAEDACARVLDAERYGVRFNRTAAGEFSLGQFPGQSHPRNLFVKGGGVGLVAQLYRACQKNDKIRIMDDFFVTGLIKGRTAGTVAGAMGLDLRSGGLTLLKAKAIVLATGGCQWLWQVNDCPADATGEGLIHAYRAGAELVDMEMVLFYPTVIVWPPSLKGAFVHYEFLDSGILDGNVYDKEGIPVFSKPLPVRDEAMRLMQQAIHEGRGTPHEGLLWYVGDSPKGTDAVRQRLNIAQYNYLKAHGVDPATDRIETAPGAHYLLGGIHIDECCRTTLQGLFATPECAGNFDGANRLAGSGIAATQVFGARAGFYAQQWAMENGGDEADLASVEEEQERVNSRLTGAGGHLPEVRHLRDWLRFDVQRYAGVHREAAGLEVLRKSAELVRTQLTGNSVAPVVYNQPLMELLQLDSMAELAGLIAGSALLRRESRGHHYRLDYPQQDDGQWLRHTSVRREGKEAVFGTRPIVRI